MMKSSSLCFAAILVILTGTFGLSALAKRRRPDPLAVPLTQIAAQISDWTAVKDQQLPEATLHALKPTAYLSRTYRKGAQDAGLFIAFYEQQRAGESMHSPKHCLPGAGWEIWGQDSATIPVRGRPARVNRYSIQNNGRRMLMFYWYQSKDRVIASEYLGKLLLARDAIVTGRTSGSIVRLMLEDVPGASEEGIALAARIIPEVDRSFGTSDPR